MTLATTTLDEGEYVFTRDEHGSAYANGIELAVADQARHRVDADSESRSRRGAREKQLLVRAIHALSFVSSGWRSPAVISHTETRPTTTNPRRSKIWKKSTQSRQSRVSTS
jgi:hypothetical protein